MLSLYADGQTLFEIGNTLGYSELTVLAILRSAVATLRARSAANAVIRFRGLQGLVDG